jgi:hypothetical protein
MLDHETVRRIAAALPRAADDTEGERLAFRAGGQLFAWNALHRPQPKTPRAPNPRVLAVSCPMERKAMLIEAAPDIYFDDDHYRGWPAVLVRLDAIEEAELAALLADACALHAAKPKRRPKPRR